MIHEAYMPVYRMSRFLARTGVRAYMSTRGSTRGPRGPKKWRFGLVTLISHRQTTEYRATQLV